MLLTLISKIQLGLLNAIKGSNELASFSNFNDDTSVVHFVDEPWLYLIGVPSERYSNESPIVKKFFPEPA
jgi:hypothetical protein